MTVTGSAPGEAAGEAPGKAPGTLSVKAADTAADTAVDREPGAARDAAPAPLLEVRGLTAGYGGGAVLHGVDATVRAGELHAVVGPNGAGKTTFLHAVAGLVPPSGGRVRVAGRDVTGKSAHVVARAGAGIVPQGRRIFPSLTVDQHLRLAERAGRRRDGGRFRPKAPAAAQAPVWTRDRVLDLLPRLGERLTHHGGELSGGEQQMLAVARALLGRPALLLLDEPTEGLAPAIADEIHSLMRELAAQGLGLLVATPQAVLVEGIADHVVYLASGRLATQADGLRLVAPGTSRGAAEADDAG
ncbi:ATP-binding cassette domain-containing protein [Yinghuangia sp. ASG 101]|uniref:ABC transporter ATP-binding protein n=1 Tax=Yinghuangia sp. ASG 101 TaxID=2896848 RepID=UPI001E43C28E|nr:ATP-binding cassette domain-containing protein [Yinghuangia sp. ASG 101]UGQ10222.1 ATP-binding cassette domain-containing protein [Yinghuangia sp. ASG 101]